VSNTVNLPAVDSAINSDTDVYKLIKSANKDIEYKWCAQVNEDTAAILINETAIALSSNNANDKVLVI
jgi:hypothetical protein